MVSAAWPLALVSCSTSRYVPASSMSAPRRRSAYELDRFEPYGVGCIANLPVLSQRRSGERPRDHDSEYHDDDDHDKNDQERGDLDADRLPDTDTERGAHRHHARDERP